MGAGRVDFNTLARQQLPFDVHQPTGRMAGEAANAGSGNHPVAGYRQRRRVAPAGVADGPGAGSQAHRQFAVGHHLPGRDGTQGRPHALLEWRALHGKGKHRQAVRCIR